MKYEVTTLNMPLNMWFRNKHGYGTNAGNFCSKRRAIRFAQYVILAFGGSAFVQTKNFEQEIYAKKELTPYFSTVLLKKLKVDGTE